jgi:predicted RNA-binding Zn-ribbon protein involved in translation (DUF1610 family)
MDKYEALAGKLRDILRPPCECLNCQLWLVERMADMLRIADAERAKETCEWFIVEQSGDGTPLSFKSTCGQWLHICEDAVQYHDKYCPHCGRRIVEKEDK